MSNYKIRFLVPLMYFESQCLEIQLAGGFLIRRANDYERQAFDDLVKKITDNRYGEFLLEYVLLKEEPETEPKKYIKEARSHIEKAITIFRLYKEEIIGFNFIVQPLSEKEPYGTTVLAIKHYMLWIPKSEELSMKPFKINSDEVDHFKEFFNEYIGIDSVTFENLDLAIEYYEKSYIEPYTPRDSFLDLMIALENLYLKGENLELKYKLAMRISHLLAKGPKGRKKIFEDVKKAYNDRSDIVHGNKIPDIGYKFFLKIREYTRESLKIFIKDPSLSNGKKLDEIVLKDEFVVKNAGTYHSKKDA